MSFLHTFMNKTAKDERALATINKYIELPEGFTLSAILEGHFKDADGNWLTGLSKGNAANSKALPTIADCVKLMKATAQQLLSGADAGDEDFTQQYDPYDHQDLNLHNRGSRY